MQDHICSEQLGFLRNRGIDILLWFNNSLPSFRFVSLLVLTEHLWNTITTSTIYRNNIYSYMYRLYIYEICENCCMIFFKKSICNPYLIPPHIIKIEHVPLYHEIILFYFNITDILRDCWFCMHNDLLTKLSSPSGFPSGIRITPWE